MDMNGLNQSGYLNTPAAGYQQRKNNGIKDSRTESTEQSQASDLKDVGGRTIGQPKLSEKALKYYEQLKKKYSNMDFILVSPEMKAEAERNKGMYGSTKSLLVLIDSDKIERMAADEDYRRKYEAILSGATAQMTQMKNSLGANADKVSAFGMTFDDNGNASFFAVVDKSLALQRERIEAKHEANLKERKQQAKKAEKKKAEERLEEKRTGAKLADKKKAADIAGGTDKVTVTADSLQALLKKIDDVIMADRADHMLTEKERSVGRAIDFSL